jgi:peptide deformylase
MTTLTLHTIPDSVLREKAKPVKTVDARIATLMEDMLAAMYLNDGIGLAANQVGILERVITVDVSKERDASKALLMANPEIVGHSEETVVSNEGCLSVPEQYAEITRFASVRVAYLDKEGNKQEIEAEGLLSRCLQHEIDHLNGQLFIDHLSPLKRKMLLKKLEKARCDREDNTVL